MRVFALVIGSIAALATVAGFFGEQWWVLDVIASFRPQYAVTLFAVAALLAMFKERTSAVWLAVAGLVNAALVAPMFVGSPLPAIGSAQLEIVSFNTHLTNPVLQLDWTLEQEPDVILLFESSRRAETELVTSTDYVVTSGIMPDREFGPTVLTREPVEIERLLPSTAIGAAIRFEISIGGRVVAVYGVHPVSPTSNSRTASRNDELRLVGERIAAEEIPVIVAGDLNATPWSHGYSLLTGPADLATTQLGTGLGATWPAHFPSPIRIPLDHVLHTRDLTTLEREVGPVEKSDHRPVRAVIGIADPAA